MVPHGGCIERRIDKDSGSRAGRAQDIQFQQKIELVNADEVGRLQKIGGGDRSVAEAQVADRLGSGLVAVIDKVALRIASLVFGQNLHAILVRSNRSVGTKTKEQSAVDAGRLDIEARVDG